VHPGREDPESGALTTQVERRRWVPRLLLVPLLVLSAYLLVANGAFWLWVADSAFRGIRAPAEPWLGVLSVFFAVVPAVGGALAFRYTRRIRPDDHVQWVAWAAAMAAMLAFVCLVVAILYSGPF